MSELGIPSRFEALIVQTSLLDELIRQKQIAQGSDERLRLVSSRVKEKNIKGSVPADPMFSGKLYFAPAFTDGDHTHGSPWSEPLSDPVPARRYYISCEISQLQGDGPTTQLQGFETTWYLPTGWTFYDQQPAVLYDEAISNPLYIRRVVTCPASPTKQGFKVVITQKYRP